MRARGKGAPTRAESVRIGGIAAGGAGVGRLVDGGVVFVAGAAPGELVQAEVDRSKKPARGRVLDVLEPSPDRVEPACPYARACGGCDLMHLAVGAQERAHAAIVHDAVAHALGGAALPDVRVHPADAPLSYRTRARLFARAERGRARVGYRVPGSHGLAEIAACAVLDPVLAPLVGELPSVLAGAVGEGDVSIARGDGARPVVELAWRGELPPALWARLDERVSSGAWAGALVRLDGAAKPASFGDPRPLLTGPDGAPLWLAAGAFAQPSEAGAVALARRVAELAAPEGRHVLELFAGSGTLSVALARGAASFTAVEIEAEAAASARENLSARGLVAKVTVADADAFPIPPRSEVVVLDPPRTGALGAANAIAASRAKTVVYVACDPPTLARDLAVLTAKTFAVTHLETFELFPQTSHVETVARLVRR
jgi:23S rRNA (uracil1939-C5)-methyltransferase